MRQVPHFLLIGNGRLARHFQHYFSLLKLSYESWHRKENLEKLYLKRNSASHIFLLINDEAIEDFILQHLNKVSALLIHCSGSLISKLAYGAHPLMCFSQQLYDFKIYQTIPFILDDDSPPFENLLPGLPNQHFSLQKSLKAKYHALCVLSGNFSCLLWQKLFSSLEKDFNFPYSIAHPYLIQNTKNLLSDPSSALTGPLVRQANDVIEKNVLALQGDPFEVVYKSFVACYQQLKNEDKLK